MCGFGGCDYNLVLVGTVKRSTYSLAGQAIATRITDDPNTSNNGLFYFLTDHLGSTTMLTNSSGAPRAVQLPTIFPLATTEAPHRVMT